MMKNKKGFLEISFAWVFALIVGAIILFLAIYFATQFLKTEQKEQDAVVSKDIGVLLNPLEISFEDIKTNYLDLPVETRIYNKCNRESPFGKQGIEVSQNSLGKWSDAGTQVSFPNKYIFSEDPIEGKKFYLFSVPFEFPFKVADLIIITPAEKNYCFIGFPKEINEDISDLKQKNFFNASIASRCPKDSEKICFNTGANCYAKVSNSMVQKGSKKEFFAGNALMYAAIFSDLDNYKCQVIRLMRRTGELSLLYNKKSMLTSKKGCSSNLNLDLLLTRANSLKETQELIPLNIIVEDIKRLNERNEVCRLW